MFNSFPICIDQNQKSIRPEVYPEIHKWITDNVPGRNFSEQTRAITNFYKKYYDKAPILSASEEVLESLGKILK